MKTSEIPQDESALKNFTDEVCYATNKDGKYEAVLSQGWSVKKEALDAAWDDIEEQKANALKDVRENKVSPIYFFMVLNLMDVALLAKYVGYWKFQVRRHFKPAVFKKMSDKKLAKYASVFKVSVEEIKNFKG